MNATLASPAMTPEELLRMPDDGHRYELVNGELKEMAVSKESSRIAGEVYFAIRAFTTDNPIGWVFPEGTAYRCFDDDPGTIRKPGTSFISLARMPLDGYEDEGYIPTVPDLVVEVISPNDIAEDVEAKLHEWLTAGVRAALIVSTHTRTVRIHHSDGRVEYLRVSDTLTLPDVLPGFSTVVALLFRRPGESLSPS